MTAFGGAKARLFDEDPAAPTSSGGFPSPVVSDVPAQPAAGVASGAASSIDAFGTDALVPLVAELKGNSLDDGPGIRSVVFFKGCPLSCVWCHNPETKRLGVELSFDQATCVGARECVSVCKLGALDASRDGFIDREVCDGCMACVEVCPSGALSAVGCTYTVDELVSAIERYVPFHRTSGGGLTLSGGEATLYPHFAGELLQRARALGIHTLLETCGQFKLSAYVEHMAPWLDDVYFDLKVIDDADHRTHCGVSNRVIHDNFRALVEAARAGEGPAVLARIPLVPGITSTDANLAAAASLLRESGVDRVALLSYNPLWHDKAAKVGAPVGYGRASWLDPDEIQHCRGFFDGFEILS